MTYETIRVEVTADKVAVITMARPQSLNAMTPQLLDEVAAAVRAAPGEGARAIVLTGEGRAFSSGADLAAGADGGLPDDCGVHLENHFNPLVEAIAGSTVPLVAAVNGPAAGAGMSIALACDIVIAVRSAYFLPAFVNIGLVPDAGLTWHLPRMVGSGRAIEMMLLGEKVPAERALNWGMVSHLVEDEELMEQALRVAGQLARGPTATYALIRKLVRDAEHGSLTESLAAERVAQREAGRTADFRNAVMAFLAKQEPVFEGR